MFIVLLFNFMYVTILFPPAGVWRAPIGCCQRSRDSRQARHLRREPPLLLALQLPLELRVLRALLRRVLRPDLRRVIPIIQLLRLLRAFLHLRPVLRLQLRLELLLRSYDYQNRSYYYQIGSLDRRSYDHQVCSPSLPFPLPV